MWAIIGGTLMGIGSRLGLGCNVGAFFVRVSQGDVSGWLFGFGMIGGGYGDAAWLKRELDAAGAARVRHALEARFRAS